CGIPVPYRHECNLSQPAGIAKKLPVPVPDNGVGAQAAPQSRRDTTFTGMNWLAFSLLLRRICEDGSCNEGKDVRLHLVLTGEVLPGLSKSAPCQGISEGVNLPGGVA
ncbi:uncharacterized, partial [Tachysurus ichikawai]